MLKPVLDSLDQVTEDLRQHYVSEGEKFVLQMDGDPHGFVARDTHVEQVNKVAEFRDNNVKLKADLEAHETALKKLDAYKDAPKIYQGTPQGVQEKVLPMIKNFYDGKDQLQRDEAIRSASLAAMVLMLAAHNRGWATVPMIGFDPEAVSQLVNPKSNYIPVMLRPWDIKKMIRGPGTIAGLSRK